MIKVEITPELAYALKTFALDDIRCGSNRAEYHADLVDLLAQLPNAPAPRAEYWLPKPWRKSA